MSLFRRPLRPTTSASEEAVARHVAAIRARLEPDPLFTRRLRGEIVNRYVAAREGIGQPARGRPEMGRLGRSVLYASFVLGIGATTVLAVAQEALPGDALYGIKLRVEQLRHEVLPAALEDDLIAIELGDRLDELDRLTRAGRTELAAALLPVIQADYDALGSMGGADAGMLAARLVVLESLLDRLPPPARAAIQEIIDRAGSANGASGSNGGGAPRDPGGGNGGANAGGGETPAGGAPGARTPEPRPTPGATPRGEGPSSPQPSKSPRPAPGG